MEKFSDWRDGPTGIAPLLPPRNKQSDSSFVSNLFSNIIFYILAPVLVILRLPIIIILTLLLVLFDYIFKNSPLGVAGRVINRTFGLVFGRIILFLFGFTFIDEAVESLSRSKSAQGSFKSVKLNDIIISNHTSYIDIIYLVYRYSPTFAVPPNDKEGTTEGRLIPLTLGGALKNAIYTPIQQYSDSVPTEELVGRIGNSWVGPLVVFAEGTTSNGLGLLEPSQVFLDVSSVNVDHFHVIGITYPSSTSVSPSFTVGSLPLHLIRMCSTIRREIIVSYLSRNCVPTLPLDGSTPQSHIDTQDVIEWFDALFKALSSLTNCRRTKITAHKKLSFVAYWRGYKVTYDKKKK